MATKKIKFPQYSHSEMLKLIYDRDATRTVRIDDSGALDKGQFVLAWDNDNAADDYPVVGAICSVTLGRYAEMSYSVLLEGGYKANFKHAQLIHAKHLPSVVSCGCELLGSECVGKLTGFYLDMHDEPFVTVMDRNGGFFIFKPEDIAYLSDVKFGIVMEESDGND